MPVDLTTTFPRRFVPAGADAGDWAQIEPLFQRLLDQVPDSPAALERWLEDVSELKAALGEERTRRYVAMTCQTDDPERERAYLDFVEHIIPKLKPMAHALDEAYLRSPHRRMLPARYALFDRLAANRVALFRPENIPLETEETKLKQQYQKITGAMTVQFRGKEHTLQQLVPYLEEPDRATRQEAWELVARRRLADRDRLEAVFEQVLALRARIAQNAGCADYREFAFRELERFDYTPDDCLRFHEAVETVVVPLVRRLQSRRRTDLSLATLRPWDLDVDPRGRPPLRPFRAVDDLVGGVEEIFRRVDPELGQQFRFMRDRDLLDLESRKGKAPGGYQSTMHEQRVPFIFMNAVGVDGDLRTLLHEGGHAFHMLAARHDPLIDYRETPMEFSEVASMAMELLAVPHLGVFYPNPDEARRAQREASSESHCCFPGSQRSMRSSTGSTRIRAIRAKSVARPGRARSRGLRPTWTLAAMGTCSTPSGTASFTCSSCRSTTLSTASPRWGRSRSGSALAWTMPPPSDSTARRSRSAERAHSATCSGRRALSSTSRFGRWAR